MAITQFPPASSYSLIKKLKFNNSKSPLLTTSTTLIGGFEMDYNATYYLIVSNSFIYKVRKSDGVIVSTGSFNNATLYSKPVIVGDTMWTLTSVLSTGKVTINFFDLLTMTGKAFNVPNGSTGTQTATTASSSLDVKYISGTTYQVLIGIPAATPGIVISSIDATLATGSTMTQITFYATPAITPACFGIGVDTNYYMYTGGLILAVIISTGVTAWASAAFTAIPIGSDFMASQTANYIYMMRKSTNPADSCYDVVAIKKTNGDIKYLGVVLASETASKQLLRNKNISSIAFISGNVVFVVKDDLTITPIMKSDDVIFSNQYTGSTTYVTNHDGIFSYDDVNKKVVLSQSSFMDSVVMIDTYSLALREYDIIG